MNKKKLTARITWEIYQKLPSSNRFYNYKIYVSSNYNPTILLEDIYFFDKIYKS